VSQALRSLITNAQDASPAGSEVLVSATCRAGVLAIDVVDRGRGMSAEVLARIGEPFYTTKRRAAAWAWACSWRGRCSRASAARWPSTRGRGWGPG
jgi:K+-sensing histidine kinase KdpD